MTSHIDDDAIRRMSADREGPVAKIVQRYAIQTETVARQLLKLPGSGRIYEPGEYFLRRGNKVYHWTRTRPAHQASAPGEPPSGDTGLLAVTLHHSLIVRNGRVVAQVRAGAKYGLYLELGTRFMKPRPFLRPALSAAMRKKL